MTFEIGVLHYSAPSISYYCSLVLFFLNVFVSVLKLELLAKTKHNKQTEKEAGGE